MQNFRAQIFTLGYEFEKFALELGLKFTWRTLMHQNISTGAMCFQKYSIIAHVQIVSR